jgi:hypothetical protein
MLWSAALPGDPSDGFGERFNGQTSDMPSTTCLELPLAGRVEPSK